MVEERDQASLGKYEIIIAVATLLLFIGTIVLAILYKKLWDMDQPLRDALAIIRQFVERYDPSTKGKDDFVILAVAQNISNQLVTWADKNDELHTEIRKITQMLKTWKLFRRALYYFAPKEITWQEAYEECLKENTSLVTVHTGEEQSFLDMEVVQTNREHWIGLRKNESLPLLVYWIDGLTVSNTYWDDGEPVRNEDARYPEECVLIGRSCRIKKCWQDRTCNQLHRFICKMLPNKKWDN